MSARDQAAARARRLRRRRPSLLGRVVDRLVPTQLHGGPEHRRARVLLATAALALCASIPGAVTRWIAGVTAGEMVTHVVVWLGFAVVPLLLRWSRSVAVTGSYLVIAGLSFVTVTALHYPGLEFVVAGWFSVLSIVSIFFLGPRIGLAVSATCMAVAGLVFAGSSPDSGPWLQSWLPVGTEGTSYVRVFSLFNVELCIAVTAAMAFVYHRELLRETDSLHRRERDFRRLTDTLAVGVFVSRGGRIVHANSTGADLIGVKLSDVQGLDFSRELSLIDSSSMLRSSTDKGEIRETEFLARDGRKRVVELASMPIEWEGRHAILHTAFDLTERKWEAEERARLEAQVRHTQKLETVGLLAGGIAHDFNNILQTILANTEMLQDLARLQIEAGASSPTPPKPRKHDPEKTHQRLDRIRVAATRGAELVEQMLAYAGRGQARIEDVEVSELTREVVSLASAAVSKKTELVLELGDGLPPVSADPTQIRQIVMNLVTNAADAVGDELGLVTVRTGVVDLEQLDGRDVFVAGELNPGRYVYIEVQDDGCGIELTEVSRIFDPFFTTKARGRGLGLAAVLGIVRSHGGTLEVDSRVGEGARFRIYLPALEGVVARPSQPSEGLVAAPRNAQILLADDEETILSSLTESLEERGFEVHVVRDGEAAVAAVREAPGRFDVVVLDMAMPRLNGAEALRAIHGIRPRLPAILSTGYAHGHDRLDPVALGFADMLRKPYRGRDLVRAIDHVLERTPTHAITPRPGPLPGPPPGTSA